MLLHIRKYCASYKILSSSFVVSLIACCICIQQSFARPFPSARTIYNAKTDLGAKGDGVTDDTEALINGYINTNKGGILYLPAGTYLVSGELKSKKCSANWIEGESKENTIIKLKDNCPGFQDASGAGKSVISWGCGGDNSFANYIQDVTIDIGTGNPGATGIWYGTVNAGAIIDVTLKSADNDNPGVFGLNMAGWQGPTYVKNVTVEGFNTGIIVGGTHAYSTYEHITLRNQKQYGLRAVPFSYPISVRKLISYNSVPAIYGGGYITILDCEFYDGSSDNYAIEKTDWEVYIRNCTMEGYKGMLTGAGEITDSYVGEHWRNVKKLFAETPDTMMKLPVLETPEVPWDDPEDWCDVAEVYGTTSDGMVNGTDIQKAIDAGYSTILLSTGYKLQNPIRINNKVRRIIGTGTEIKPWGCDFQDIANVKGQPLMPMWKVEDGEADVVELTHFHGTIGGYNHIPFVEVATQRTVVLSSVSMMLTFCSVDGGNLFMDDIGFPSFRMGKKNVWMRSINPEYMAGVPATSDVDGMTGKIYNRGGMLWSMGAKQEGGGAWCQTYSGGFTEILGTLIRTIVNSMPADTPVIRIDNSNVSMAGFIQFNTGTIEKFEKLVIETRANQTEFMPGGQWDLFPDNYVGYDPEAVNNLKKNWPESRLRAQRIAPSDHVSAMQKNAQNGRKHYYIYNLQGRQLYSGAHPNWRSLRHQPIPAGVTIIKAADKSGIIRKKVLPR